MKNKPDISLNKPQWNPNLSIVEKDRYVREWQMKNPGAKVVPWLIYREAGFYVS